MTATPENAACWQVPQRPIYIHTYNKSYISPICVCHVCTLFALCRTTATAVTTLCFPMPFTPPVSHRFPRFPSDLATHVSWAWDLSTPGPVSGRVVVYERDVFCIFTEDHSLSTALWAGTYLTANRRQLTTCCQPVNGQFLVNHRLRPKVRMCSLYHSHIGDGCMTG